MQKKELKPHVRVLKLSGGTGDGKSQIASVFASAGARKIIGRSIGKTNSTLKERLIVYTDNLEGQILVAVKLNEHVLERNTYSEVITTVLAKYIRRYGKKLKNAAIKLDEELGRYFTNELKRNNTKAILSFLSEEQKNEFIKRINECLIEADFFKKSFKIYNTVRNQLKEGEVKENSVKFLDELIKEVGKVIESMNEDFQRELWSAWEDLNNQLLDFFYEYFNVNQISEDDYYYIEVDVNNPDEEFVNAMFTANDIQDGGKISLEVFCEEIVIYAPLDNRIAEIINNDVCMLNAFTDSHGNIAFGIFDTRGLFHANAEEGENQDYFNELLYHGDSDALLLVAPMYGDSNEIKIRGLYREAFTSFKKQIPVFMFNNKVDLFIDYLNKSVYDDDPLSIDMNKNNELSSEEIEIKVEHQLKQMTEEIETVQNKTRKDLKIVSLPCYLKRDRNMPEVFVKKYNIKNAIITMLKETANYLEKTSTKIPYIIEDSIEDDIRININKSEVKTIIHKYLIMQETDRKVLSPAMQNINDNTGITPHGNGYNALRKRLKNGEGFNSKIDELYYKNCESFSIDFPGNLRNFLTEDLLFDIMNNVVSLEGGEYECIEDRERFINLTIENIKPFRFVAYILYNHALLDAESVAFSFYNKFNRFLNRSQCYFDEAELNENVYEDAIMQVVHDAISRTISLNFVYK